MNKTPRYIATGGIIAAIYVVLTFISSLFGLSNGIFQIRISEALCILPVFTGAAVPGLFVGCIISNLLFGGGVIDIVFGSIATLIGAVLTRMLKNNRWIALIPPVISNTLIIPLVQIFAFSINESFWYLAFLIFVSEMISCYGLGQLLFSILKSRNVNPV